MLSFLRSPHFSSLAPATMSLARLHSNNHSCSCVHLTPSQIHFPFCSLWKMPRWALVTFLCSQDKARTPWQMLWGYDQLFSFLSQHALWPSHPSYPVILSDPECSCPSHLLSSCPLPLPGPPLPWSFQIPSICSPGLRWCILCSRTSFMFTSSLHAKCFPVYTPHNCDELTNLLTA